MWRVSYVGTWRVEYIGFWWVGFWWVGYIGFEGVRFDLGGYVRLGLSGWDILGSGRIHWVLVGRTVGFLQAEYQTLAGGIQQLWAEW